MSYVERVEQFLDDQDVNRSGAGPLRLQYEREQEMLRLLAVIADAVTSKPAAYPGSPAVAADLYERPDPEDDDSPDDSPGYPLHGCISDRVVPS